MIGNLCSSTQQQTQPSGLKMAWGWNYLRIQLSSRGVDRRWERSKNLNNETPSLGKHLTKIFIIPMPVQIEGNQKTLPRDSNA